MTARSGSGRSRAPRGQGRRKPAGSGRKPAGARRKPGLVIAAVRPIVERLAADRDLILWDVEFRREAGQEIVRVALDRAGGIDAGELSRFSEALSREVDETDAVSGEARYTLEVSSPGAERRLRSREEFEVCRGRHARVTFRDGRQPVEGTIADVGEGNVRIDPPSGDEVEIAFDDISQARLSVPGV